SSCAYWRRRCRAGCRRPAAPRAARCRARAAIPQRAAGIRSTKFSTAAREGVPRPTGVGALDELGGNVMNTPIEAIETEFPIRVERYELACDSAGPGKFR